MARRKATPVDLGLRPYDPRGDETAAAFRAFAIYRNLGPGRTVAQVAKLLERNPSNLEKWCTRHDWVARAAAFDAVAEVAAADEVLEREITVRVRQAKFARVLQQRAVETLAGTKANPKTPLTNREAIHAFRVGVEAERRALGMADRIELGGADGGPIQTQDVPFDWKAALGGRPPAGAGLDDDDSDK